MTLQLSLGATALPRVGMEAETKIQRGLQMPAKVS